MLRIGVIFCVLVFGQFSWADEWEFLSEEGGTKIYSGKDYKGTILPFKAVRLMPHPLSRLVQTLFDYEKKVTWAPKLKSVKLFKVVSPTEFYFQERYQPPWPAQHRLFNLYGKVSSDFAGHLRFAAKNADDPSMRDDCCIESHVFLSEISLSSLSSQNTRVTLIFIGELGGWIPSWLNNMLQRAWPSKFLTGLERAAFQDPSPSSAYDDLVKVFGWLDHKKHPTAH